MDPNVIASMAFTLIFTVIVGGFVLLYPVSKRLGLFLESKLHEKKPGLAPGNAEMESLRGTLLSLESDVRRISERQEFMEQLLAKKTDPASLPGSGSRGVER